jgi:L-histidine Nalpha-methyltransferase
MTLATESLRDEILEGLSGTPPTLPPKLFYDDVGARLFEEITTVPEYYPTRTELGILREHLPDMARRLGPEVVVVEFGSGSGRKTELLLDALEHPAAYIPVDIAREQLEAVAARMDRDFPALRVLPLAADYTRPFHLPDPGPGSGPPLLFFPGSTVGNFEPPDAEAFLRQARESMGPGAALLIGVDLVKPQAVLEPAYDDARGVTAAFNRNALVNLNRLLGTDFDPEAFQHRAIWNEQDSRIEMHLVAMDDQEVHLPAGEGGGGATRFSFRRGEFIVTEHSYKYTLDGIEALMAASGWQAVESWTDPEQWFAVTLAVASGGG